MSLLALAAITGQVRTPRGIYAVVNIQEQVDVQTQANPSITPAQLESYFVSLYQQLLSNPAVSGLMIYENWATLNPNPVNDTNAYDWSYLDDAFTQAAAWNLQNLANAPKTIQLVPSLGFQTPQWVLDQIPSCDGMFQTPAQTVQNTCGKVTFEGFVEGGGTRELPLPWNPVYKSAWRTFVTALATRYGSNPLLVSIAVAGPTASSEEMILPDNANTPAQDQFGGILPNDMWIELLAFDYPGMAAYQKSDQAFIDEWEAAIDAYGQIFSGVTLVATTGSGLPNLRATGFAPPPSEFSADCPNPDMDCAAETTILAYFATPTVGGANAKAVQEDGMEAARPVGPFNLGVGGIKLVSQVTKQGAAPAAQVLGGSQFNSSFANFTLQEGCTSKFPPNSSDQQAGCSIPASCTIQACIPVACIPNACLAPGIAPADIQSFKTLGGVPPKDLISPEQALYNVLNTYFDGTAVASSFGGTSGTVPLNYLQIYAPDFQYAAAHVNASAQVVQTNGAAEAVAAQSLLDQSSQELLGISEPAVAVNAAGIVIHGGTATVVSPGSLVDVYGTNMTVETLSAPSGGALPDALGGVQVMVNGTAAPLIYVSPLQIIFQLPYETGVGTASVGMVSDGLPSAEVPIAVKQAAPNILTFGANRAVVINPDGSVNASGNGASPGSVLLAYLIGSGPLNNPVATGAPAPSSPLSQETLTTTASVGGSPATVQYAGMAPGYVGLMQVNFVTPNLVPGDYPIQITIGSAPSNQPLVTIAK